MYKKYSPLIAFILFGCFISLTPSFDLILWLGRYDEKRIFELSLLFLAAANIILSKNISSTSLQIYLALPRQSRWALIYIIAVGILSSILAPSSNHAFMELSLFSLLFFWSLYTASNFQEHGTKLVYILFIGIYSSAFFYEITFFTSYIGILIQSNPLVLPEPFSGFSNYRFFNQFQIWTLPLLSITLLLHGKKLPSSLRILAHIIAIGWWVLLFASESRGAIAALIFSFTITLIAFQNNARALLLNQAYSALLGLTFYLLLFVIIPESTQAPEFGNIANSNGRIQLWTNAWEIIKNNPVLGIGPMHFAYYPNPASLAHPHSSLIQFAAEWGLPSALLITALFIGGSISWIKKFKYQTRKSSHTTNPLWIALFNAFIAGSMYSLVSGVIVTPLSQMMLATILGIMLGMYFTEAREQQTTIQNRTTFNTLAISTLLLAITLITPQIQYRFENEPPYLQKTTPIVGPRFWQEGGIPTQ